MALIFFCITYLFLLFPRKTLHAWAGDSVDYKANDTGRKEKKKQCLIKEIDTETFPHKYIQYRTHSANSPASKFHHAGTNQIKWNLREQTE